MRNESAILILSHVWDADIERLLKNINSGCSARFDVFLLADNTRGLFSGLAAGHRTFLFTRSDLEQLEYSGKNEISYAGKPSDHGAYHRERNFMMGNTELPVIYFSKRNPGYEYYWVVEYDVRFSGNWLTFFSYFAASNADLLGTSFIGHDSLPNWPKWETLKLPGHKISKTEFLRAFFPIYRISAKALAQLDKDLKSGAAGHYECLMPTLLNHAGLTLEDIGGQSKFTKPENLNRFYQNTPTSYALKPGTFVFRPVRNSPGKKPDTLWHPVKSRPFWRVWLSRIRSAIFD